MGKQELRNIALNITKRAIKNFYYEFDEEDQYVTILNVKNEDKNHQDLEIEIENIGDENNLEELEYCIYKGFQKHSCDPDEITTVMDEEPYSIFQENFKNGIDKTTLKIKNEEIQKLNTEEELVEDYIYDIRRWKVA